MKPFKSFQSVVNFSVDTRKSEEYDCDIDLEVLEFEVNAYSVHISNREFTFYTDIGTFTYIVDMYGDAPVASLHDWELDESVEIKGNPTDSASDNARALVNALAKRLKEVDTELSKKYPPVKFKKSDVVGLCKKFNKDILFNFSTQFEEFEKLSSDKKIQKWNASVSLEHLIQISNWILDYYDLNLMVKLSLVEMKQLNRSREVPFMVFVYHDYDDKIYLFPDPKDHLFLYGVCKRFNLYFWIAQLFSFFHSRMNEVMKVKMDKNWKFDDMKEAFEKATYYTDQYFIDMEE